MPIKIVLNGYFRSGTTFLWDFLKNNLREQGYLCFYEPLHPNLAYLIQREKGSNSIDVLHERKLWQDYLELEEEVLNLILRNNPNANGVGINTDVNLINYLDIYHSLEKDVFLQANRLHFHLDLLFEKYNTKVIHVVRHPLDVYLSIKKAFKKTYIGVAPILKKIIRFPLLLFKRSKAFETQEIFQWIVSRVGLPYQYYESWKMKFLFSKSLFYKVIFNWTISNYFAIKSIEKYGGFLCIYEDIITNPQKFVEKINKYIGIKLTSLPKVKKYNFYKFDDKYILAFRKAINFYQIEKYFAYIISKIEKEGIVWKVKL